jgi:uncharacterized protein (TIGR02300 family)
MARDLGSKFTCFNCGTRFYDLHKPEPVCPKCGADQREATKVSAIGERRRSRAAEPATPEPEEVEKDAASDETEEIEPADTEDDEEDEEEDDED